MACTATEQSIHTSRPRADARGGGWLTDPDPRKAVMNTDRMNDRHEDAEEVAPDSDQVQLPWRYTITPELLRLQDRTRLARSEEINRAARLDWGVYQTAAFFFVAGDTASQPEVGADGAVVSAEGGNFKLAATRRSAATVPESDCLFNVRDDVHDVVGLVRRRYRVLQNAEAPVFLDHLVDAGAAVFETAGALHRGARVFWLARFEQLDAEAGSERLDTYLLLENSHDGSKSFALAALSVRPLSRTALVWRLPSTPRVITLRHTDSAKDAQMTAQRALALASAYAAEGGAIRDQMLQIAISDAEVRGFLDTLVPTPVPILKGGRTVNQRGITMADNTKGVITQIYHHNESHENIRGTLWGLVQACAFYSNHMSISRNTDDASAAENRLKRLLSEATLGAKAFELALQLL